MRMRTTVLRFSSVWLWSSRGLMSVSHSSRTPRPVSRHMPPSEERMLAKSSARKIANSRRRSGCFCKGSMLGLMDGAR